MGDPGSSSDIPPYRPRGPRTGRHGGEVLFDPATDGPRTRAQSRAAAPETAAASPQASDRTAAAVRALLAEGAPGRALHLLTSDGVCDAADPAVLTSLRELHPQAESPKLEPPLPEDRNDVRHGRPTSSWPWRPCTGTPPAWQRGGALSTATSSGRLHPRAAPNLRAARLIPLRKEDGVVRPIAVGETLRWLVAKWLLASA